MTVIKCLIWEVFICSKTSASERAMVIGLGGVNLFGVIILGAMLKYDSLEIDFCLVFLPFISLISPLLS